MRIILMTMLSVLMLGCTTTMSHPSKVSIDQDNYECGIVAERRAAAWGGGGDFGINFVLYGDFINECLERRGWSKVR